jgi:2-methylcitrate dehydratase PrpD
MSKQDRSITAAIVDTVAERFAGPLPDAVRQLARQCVLDWFGCSLGGRDEPLVRLLLEQAREEGSRPLAGVVGAADRMSPRWAALLNGAMGHAIDYDDVNAAMGGHPTAAILPAILALAEAEGSDGDAVLRAFAAGYEAAAMVGLLVAPGHYARGFHATGTVGAIGTAIGCATLLGLDRNASARALGIAATQAAGLKAQFGTMCKPLHAGKSSENGLLAAMLARRGFESRTDILECEQGFAATQSPDFDPAAALEPARGGFHILDNLFKYNAACYGTHGAIEAARRLAASHDLGAGRIRRIEVRAEQSAERMCNIINPRTGLEGKFSLRFNTALAITGGDTSAPATYTEATVSRPDLVALQQRIDVVMMPADWPRFHTEVLVETTDGQSHVLRHDTSQPASDLDAQGERLRGKFTGLASPVLGSESAERLARAIEGFGAGTTAGELMTLASR